MPTHFKFHKEDQLIETLKKHIDNKTSSDKFVALDADGTLWFKDANSLLLQYEKQHKLRDVQDILNIYGAQSRPYLRCSMLAKKQAGFHIDEFRQHCRSVLKKQDLGLFPFQRRLLTYLKQQNMKICIVTASIKWLVEEACKFYDLPIDMVLGVENKLQAGILTEDLVEPSPIHPSKKEVFLNYTQGQTCFLAAGNTPADLPLLEMAKHAFVVRSCYIKNKDFLCEEDLQKHAKTKNWPVFKLIK